MYIYIYMYICIISTYTCFVLSRTHQCFILPIYIIYTIYQLFLLTNIYTYIYIYILCIYIVYILYTYIRERKRERTYIIYISSFPPATFFVEKIAFRYAENKLMMTVALMNSSSENAANCPKKTHGGA